MSRGTYSFWNNLELHHQNKSTWVTRRRMKNKKLRTEYKFRGRIKEGQCDAIIQIITDTEKRWGGGL